MKNNKFLLILLQLFALVLFAFCLYVFIKGDRNIINPKQAQASQSVTKKVSKSTSKAASDLPKLSTKDWQLVLVNRDHPKDEMNPELADINGIYVDARIADAATNFLAAAQAIDPQEHLISGYRSVEYQAQLYQGYVDQEMANDPSLTQEAAEKVVQTYSQPAGSSEHQTGLAIDMSTVDQLNQSDPAVVKQIVDMAPDYGFVLRFKEDKKASTGVGYEDWHYRYVGKKAATYMTKHNLSLEEFIKALKENE